MLQLAPAARQHHPTTPHARAGGGPARPPHTTPPYDTHHPGLPPMTRTYAIDFGVILLFRLLPEAPSPRALHPAPPCTTPPTRPRALHPAPPRTSDSPSSPQHVLSTRLEVHSQCERLKGVGKPILLGTSERQQKTPPPHPYYYYYYCYYTSHPLPHTPDMLRILPSLRHAL